MTAWEARAALPELWEQYRAFQARGLALDMSRGKPSEEQLTLSLPLIQNIDYRAEDGLDARNYGGGVSGVPEARRLFGEMLGVPSSQVMVGGNSSLNLISDALQRALLLGPLPGDKPWCRVRNVAFICPVPGYDWHFHMLESLGVRMLPVPTDERGPDMAQVARLARDPSVKGLICVPKYGNPTGVTYAPDVIARLAEMPAAPDFRLFFDNAYCVHDIDPDNPDALPNLYDACSRAGHPDRALLFTSFSKITFPAGGMAAMAASPRNIARQQALATYQLVNHDKMNQLRHARFLPDLASVKAHMARHAALIRPKFAFVLDALERELSGVGRWRAPRGGYFICYEAPRGCARRIVALCADAGVTLTPAGAAFPYGHDPDDSVIRIAPTYPPLDELAQVMALFPIAVRIAAAEAAERR